MRRWRLEDCGPSMPPHSRCRRPESPARLILRRCSNSGINIRISLMVRGSSALVEQHGGLGKWPCGLFNYTGLDRNCGTGIYGLFLGTGCCLLRWPLSSLLCRLHFWQPGVGDRHGDKSDAELQRFRGLQMDRSGAGGRVEQRHALQRHRPEHSSGHQWFRLDVVRFILQRHLSSPN